MPSCFDDGILLTPHFSTHLPYPSSIRCLSSSPRHSGPPQKVSSTPVSRSTPLTLGSHPLSFFPIPSPQHPTSSYIFSLSVLASVSFPSSLLLSLHVLLASCHSVLLHLRQVAQCAMSCPFLTDIAWIKGVACICGQPL